MFRRSNNTDAGGSRPAIGSAARRRKSLVRRAIGLAVWLGAVVLWPGPAPGDGRDSFETAETSWRLADADCSPRVLAHQRMLQVAHSGQASEHFSLSAAQGTFVHVVHHVERARVIPEWTPSLWVRSDRPGMQFMARAVLPRTVEPQSRQPMAVLLRGDIYERVGAWQQLWVHRADQLLERQVRVLRSQYQLDIDAREAYIDLVVVNAYGGVGVTNLWLDDLEIQGAVPAAGFAELQQPQSMPGAPGAPQDYDSAVAARGAEAAVQLRGSVLQADGLPLFPRAIQYNGESLEFLRGLGFNAVRLAAAPSGVELREAERLGLWLIAPPPNDGFVTPSHDRVLAWDLGPGLTAQQLELTRNRVAALRQADLRANRPLLAQPLERVWNYSRLANLLLLSGEPLGGSLPLDRYAAGLEQRSTLGRPGTPYWAAVQTEPAAAVIDQWTAVGMGPPVSLVAEPEQIRLLTYQSIASGARGLLFSSRSPLDRSDADTASRARTLKQLNLELQAVEPWCASGQRLPEVDSGRPDVRVGVLQTERAQLLIILGRDARQQYTCGPAAAAPLTLVVPSVINAPQVYRLRCGTLQTLLHRRVAGGIRFTLDSLEQVDLVAIAQDPLVLNHLVRTLAATKSQLAGLLHETTVSQLELVELLHGRLAGQSSSLATTDAWLQQARANLRHCQMLLGANDQAAACEFAAKSLDAQGHVRRFYWDHAAGVFPSPVASAYLTSFAALPLHWEMARRLQAAPQWSGNALAAGDFESLEHLRSTGWQNLADENRSLRTSVELTGESVRDGRAALKLAAWAADPREVPTALERPPLRIVSAPMVLRRGQLARIHGWVRVPREIQSSVDGLKIYDSLAGESLAQRFQAGPDWQEFVLYRAADRDSELRITFDLTGLGEAWIDDLSVSVHESIADRSQENRLEEAQRLPPTGDSYR